jgi:hypothetical protein
VHQHLHFALYLPEFARKNTLSVTFTGKTDLVTGINCDP